MYGFEVLVYNSSLMYTVSNHITDSYVDTDKGCIGVVTDNVNRFWREYMMLEERFGLTAVPVV